MDDNGIRGHVTDDAYTLHLTINREYQRSKGRETTQIWENIKPGSTCFKKPWISFDWSDSILTLYKHLSITIDASNQDNCDPVTPSIRRTTSHNLQFNSSTEGSYQNVYLKSHMVHPVLQMWMPSNFDLYNMMHFKVAKFGVRFRSAWWCL